MLKAARNELGYSRYGFSVSKQVGNAVVRNRTKRMLREILRITKLEPGWDIVFIARKPSAGAQFGVMSHSVTDLLSRARMLVE